MLANLISRTIFGILSIAASAMISLLIQQYLLPFMARSPHSTAPNNLSPETVPSETVPSETVPPEPAATHSDPPNADPPLQPETSSPIVEESSSAIAPEVPDAPDPLDTDQEKNSRNPILEKFLEKLDK